MKKLGISLVLLAAFAAAQQPAAPADLPARTNLVERPAAVSDSDLYCAGFITNQSIASANKIVGSWDTPHQTRYSDRETVYLSGGAQEGQQFAILRKLRNPQPIELYPGQRLSLRGLGDMWAELGRVKVVGQRGNVAVATVEFACDAMVPGDIAVPWLEKQRPALWPAHAFDKLAPPNGKATGRIAMARDFDYLAGTQRKVYLDIGADQGVKVGDYFRATRTYEQQWRDPVDSISFRAPVFEDTQKDPPEHQRTMAAYGRQTKDLPRKSIGEMVVLSVSPRSSTAMITYAVEAIQIGDGVEMMDPPPPAPAPVETPAAPPTISCVANPGTVRVGDSATIRCEGISPDNRPLTYSFEANRGRISPRDTMATLNTTGVEAGPISVRTVVMDDRNMSAEFITLVNVEAPPAAPVARKLNEVQFRANSAYVDNRAKAILDDVALAAQREPDSIVGVVTFTDEREAGRLAELRAQNIARYLTRDKGLDASRVQAQPGPKGGRKGDLWMVPPGASVPPPTAPQEQH